MPRSKSTTSDQDSKKTCLLTVAQINNTVPDTGKNEKNLNDGGGLWCVITANRKRWQYQYSVLGKKGKMWLGEYPLLSLANARLLRDEQAAIVATGQNPVIAKQTAKLAAQYSAENTFEIVAR
jgi:hypothetical protein